MSEHPNTDAAEVAYRIVATPIGALLIAATARGLVRVAFEVEGFDTVLATVAERLSATVVQAGHQLDEVAGQLAEYFLGQRRDFDLPLDFTLSGGGFREQVQRHLASIDYGHTRTYAEVAAEVGNPKAVRAVGSACATNPLPVVIPCHRVLRSDGTLGGYLAGAQVKTVLLDLERAPR